MNRRELIRNAGIIAVSPSAAIAATRPVGGPILPPSSIANLNRTASKIVYHAKQGSLAAHHVAAATGSLRTFFAEHPDILTSLQTQADTGAIDRLTPTPEEFKSRLATVVPGTEKTDYNTLESGLQHRPDMKHMPVSLMVNTMLDDLEEHWQGPVTAGVRVRVPLNLPSARKIVYGNISCWPAVYGALTGLLALVLTGVAAIAFGILAFIYAFEAVFMC